MSTVYIGTAEAAARAKHHFWPAEADVVKRLRNEAILLQGRSSVRLCKKREKLPWQAEGHGHEQMMESHMIYS